MLFWCQWATALPQERLSRRKTRTRVSVHAPCECLHVLVCMCAACSIGGHVVVDAWIPPACVATMEDGAAEGLLRHFRLSLLEESVVSMAGW